MNVESINGWNYHEMMLLIGISIVSSQIIFAVSFVANIWRLPKKINDGEIDMILVKPLSSLFLCTLGEPYIFGFVGSLSGIYIIFCSLKSLDITWSIFRISAAFVVFISGLVIHYSIYVIITSFSFIFRNKNILPQIATSILEFQQNPHSIYKRFLHYTFFYLMPVVFIASVPAELITAVDLDFQLVVQAIVLACIGFIMTKIVWRKMLRYYSSASS